jgi:KUP system potassium uptake protein
VVYGDIGTSPIYALRESLRTASETGAPAETDVIAIVSLLLWLLIIIATLKYVILVLEADNNGEGGTLSLLALCQRALRGRRAPILALGIIGMSLFFGDAIITPAISVLSAVEGATHVAPGLKDYILPITLAILLMLFWFQRRGTARVSRLFAPVMMVWFLAMTLLGLSHIADDLTILRALSPRPGLDYLLSHGLSALPVLGSVFLGRLYI